MDVRELQIHCPRNTLKPTFLSPDSCSSVSLSFMASSRENFSPILLNCSCRDFLSFNLPILSTSVGAFSQKEFYIFRREKERRLWACAWKGIFGCLEEEAKSLTIFTLIVSAPSYMHNGKCKAHSPGWLGA